MNPLHGSFKVGNDNHNKTILNWVMRGEHETADWKWSL